MEELQLRFKEELARFSHFHKRLEQEEQLLFEDKAWLFFSKKRFESVELPEVSFRMKLIVSAYAAQITFGYDDVFLSHFHTVVIHPAPYLSHKVGNIVRGEASSKGIVELSWLDLAEGHNNFNNGVNLALHEFAHALEIENITGPEEYHFIDAQAILVFTKVAETEIEKMRNGSHHFLRSYAASNTAEFFAVSVENFFERPVEMEQELPDVFHAMVKMLRLNPCNRIVRNA